MSYQVLARKYRPKNFASLVGQEHVVRALSHALASGRLHHAYLFTGTRGVGKTTLSRILAKSLNCIGPDGTGGITDTPCGVCDACTAIDAGRFVDYIEMDAASNRGVDEMAALLEQAVYAPSNARFKVYMIDEVHMLTNHAFNSMLKTLEEPPEHVKFILATTDPQKIPVTVLSRCLQFNLKQMPPGQIIGHLENILGQEAIEFDTPALRLLAQGAHGSMRDALSLTDQAIAYAAGKVTLDAVQGMLGALDQSYLVRVLDALAAQDGADMLAVANDMASRSLSYNGALQDLATLLHRIALAQTVPSAVPEDLPELADILRLAKLFDAEEVQLFYQIAVHGRNELGLAPDDFAGFTMTLLRMLAFRPGTGGTPPASAPPGARTAQARSGAAMPASVSAAPRTSSPVVSAAPAVVAAAVAAVAAVAAPAAAASTALSPPGGMRAAPPSASMPAAAAVAPAARPAGLSPAMAALAAARSGSAGAASRNPPRADAAAHTAAVAAPAAAVPPPPDAMHASPAPAPASPAFASAPPTARPDAASAPAVAAASSAGGGVVAPPPVAAVSTARAATVASVAAVANAGSALDDQSPPPWATAAPWDDEQGWTSVATMPDDFNDAMPGLAAGMPAAPSAPATAPAMARLMAAIPNAPASRAAPPPTVQATPMVPVRVKFDDAPAKPLVLTPVPSLQWDGDWQTLAQNLPVRGVAQQLTLQSELVSCDAGSHVTVFHLIVPIDTWRTDANIEKLSAALSAHFNTKVEADVKLGAVAHSASIAIAAERDRRQQQAEQTVHNDPFVQKMMREFNAIVVPGSVKPLFN